MSLEKKHKITYNTINDDKHSDHIEQYQTIAYKYDCSSTWSTVPVLL